MLIICPTPCQPFIYSFLTPSLSHPSINFCDYSASHLFIHLSICPSIPQTSNSFICPSFHFEFYACQIICSHTHTYKLIHIHTHTHTYTHSHTHFTYTHAYSHIHTHTHIHSYTHTQTYTYIHIHTQTHTHTLTHVHTHTHA